MDKALILFETMQKNDIQPDVYTFSTIVDGFCKTNRIEEGLNFINKMTTVQPNVFTYTTVIDACCAKLDMIKAEQVFETMKSKGIVPTIYTLNSFVKGYNRLDRMDKMSEKVREMKTYHIKPDNTTWNIMIDFYAKKGDIFTCLKIFNTMRLQGYVADRLTYNTLVIACIARKDLTMSDQVLGMMMENGMSPDVFTFTSLISGTLEIKRNLADGFYLLDKMMKMGVQANLATYNALLSGVARLGNFKQIKPVYEQIQKTLKPDCYTMSSILDSCTKNGTLQDLKDMWILLKKDGVVPNTINWSAYLNGLIEFSAYQICVDEFKSTLEKRGLDRQHLLNCFYPKLFTRIEFEENMLEFKTFCEHQGLVVPYVKKTSVMTEPADNVSQQEEKDSRETDKDRVVDQRTSVEK
jgi:pentatricopeptide repeat protein